MSLTVQALNADTTFLITLTPSFAPLKSKRKFPGSVTILVDPWLDGPSTILHPKFATSRHSKPVAIRSLAELEHEVDLIVISQDKADHLSKSTLCSLSKNTTTKIFAPRKAAKKILDWQYFEHPDIVHVLQPYNAKKPDTVTRISIEPYSSASADGELTIAYMYERRDLTELHNAIGITYCPPGTLLTAPHGLTVKLADMPTMSATLPTSSVISTLYSKQDCLRVSSGRDICPRGCSSQNHTHGTFLQKSLFHTHSPCLKPSTAGSQQPPRVNTVLMRQENYEDVISVIYTPHGINAASIKPYISNHLSQLNGALPVTALFHSINMETNPWWLGGVVMNGAPGGVKVASEVAAKYWISAHDEVKQNAGWAATITKSKPFDLHDVTRMLREAAGSAKARTVETEVVLLGIGQQKRFMG